MKAWMGGLGASKAGAVEDPSGVSTLVEVGKPGGSPGGV